MAKITLVMEVTDEQQSQLIERFIQTAQAVTENGAAPAPTPAAPQQETPSKAAEGAPLDDRGVPWHGDYHAATKTKTAKGAWKKRKGADHAEIDAYEFQYLNKQAAAPAPAVNDDPNDLTIPAFLDRSQNGAMPGADPIPMPTGDAGPAMPTAPAGPPAMPAAPAAAPEPITYEAMMQVFGEVSERLGGDYVVNKVSTEIYPKLGISDAEVLTSNETLRASLVAELRAMT